MNHNSVSDPGVGEAFVNRIEYDPIVQQERRKFEDRARQILNEMELNNYDQSFVWKVKALIDQAVASWRAIEDRAGDIFQDEIQKENGRNKMLEEMLLLNVKFTRELIELYSKKST